MYYLGCPMWANDQWRGSLFDAGCPSSDFLVQYSRYFNAVEGNTTFYANPSAATVLRWQTLANAGFRFTFKVPQQISHRLRGAERAAALAQWLELLQPLRAQIGLSHLQLSAQYLVTADADFLPLMQQLRQFSPVAVEVRHPAFF